MARTLPCARPRTFRDDRRSTQCPRRRPNDHRRHARPGPRSVRADAVRAGAERTRSRCNEGPCARRGDTTSVVPQRGSFRPAPLSMARRYTMAAAATSEMPDPAKTKARRAKPWFAHCAGSARSSEIRSEDSLVIEALGGSAGAVLELVGEHGVKGTQGGRVPSEAEVHH